MPAKVKLSLLLEHLDLPSDEFRSFLDRSTGEVVMVSNDELSRAEEIGKDDDSEWPGAESFQDALAIIKDEEDQYVELPDQYEIDEYGIMEDFCFEISELKIRDPLLQAIKGKGAFRRFKDKVRNFGIEGQWRAFREQKLKEIAIEWCEDHQIPFTDDVS
ncbi:MAG: UPF0158 family protein [Firmicutes bacterium]|nr:UPF0158 family protein [Bacillota bacterium]